MLHVNSKQIAKITKTTKFVVNMVTVFPRMSRVTRGDWLKNELQTLGPTYVKIGQFLASRPDVIGEDKNLIKSLKELHDSVDPLPWNVVSKVIDENVKLGAFKIIDKKPLASASIAQVHRATLKNGKQVVIKMKRPYIDEEVKTDLQVIGIWLSILALFLGNTDNKIVDAQNMIRDIQMSILRETDLGNEVANMERLAKASEDSRSMIKVPKVYKELSSSNVIVMEYVPSVKFRVDSDPKLSYMIMDVFVQQFLQHGIIHGDPHEGNVALSLDRKNLVMYDLGHVIYLDERLRSQMKILVFEIMTENIQGVIKVMKNMPELIQIRQEEQTAEYIANYIKYIKTIDIKILKSMSQTGDIPIKFSGTIYEIVRTFGIVEGICIDLDPSFSYDNVFVKYIDILLLDSDFISYKIEHDFKMLFGF